VIDGIIGHPKTARELPAESKQLGKEAIAISISSTGKYGSYYSTI
jgi:hypothetical protein